MRGKQFDRFLKRQENVRVGRGVAPRGFAGIITGLLLALRGIENASAQLPPIVCTGVLSERYPWIAERYPGLCDPPNRNPGNNNNNDRDNDRDRGGNNNDDGRFDS